MRIFGFLVIALLLVGLLFTHPHQTQAQPGPAGATAMTAQTASILAYHRIDEDNSPATNLRLEDFRAQIMELEHGGYSIIPLAQLVEALKNNTPLPERSIVITFEGAYLSAYRNAMPILLEKRIPFTVFYASGNSDDTSNQYMGWADLKNLARYHFVDFGILPAVYTHLADFSPEENKRLLNNARIAYRQHFGKEAAYFSYPFGEHNSAYKKVIESGGFDAAFGLQSGVPYPGMDLYNIPRFTMTEGFGDIERFRTIVNARPVPAYDIEPQNHTLSATDGAPLFGFSVPEKDAEILKNIQCFFSGLGQAKLSIIGQTRLEIRPQFPLDDDRIRINCTANTGTKEEPQWHWFGMLYTMNAAERSAAQGEEQDFGDLSSNTAFLRLNTSQDELPPPRE